MIAARQAIFTYLYMSFKGSPSPLVTAKSSHSPRTHGYGFDSEIDRNVGWLQDLEVTGLRLADARGKREWILRSNATSA
jgi:hypothetical protein